MLGFHMNLFESGGGQDATGEEGAPATRPPAAWRAIRGPGLLLSARRLWLLSAALHQRGHGRSARAVKWFNGILFNNSLPPEADVSPEVRLGHQGLGTVIHPKTTIGRRVKIMQNVTIAVKPPKSAGRVVIEDDVVIGAGAVIMTPHEKSVRIGEGAQIGANAIVTHDVPPHMSAVGPVAEIRPPRHVLRASEDDDE
jgi:serine O-acetyltransferase